MHMPARSFLLCQKQKETVTTWRHFSFKTVCISYFVPLISLHALNKRDAPPPGVFPDVSLKEHAMTAKTNAKTAAATNKAAAPKKPAAGRTTRKPVAAKPTINFIIQDFARAQISGGRLEAFTAAWLDLTGLNAGKAIAKDQLAKVSGPRAIAYHIGLKNIEKTVDGLKLTEKGQMFFAARTKIDPQLVEAYKAVLATGKVEDCLQIANPKAIVKIA
jgi:hypothetical protein